MTIKQEEELKELIEEKKQYMKEFIKTLCGKEIEMTELYYDRGIMGEGITKEQGYEIYDEMIEQMYDIEDRNIYLEPNEKTQCVFCEEEYEHQPYECFFYEMGIKPNPKKW